MKINDYVIPTILKSEPIGQLISRLLTSSLPGSASRMHVELLGKPRYSTSILEALAGQLDIKRHSPSIFYISQIQGPSEKIKKKTRTMGATTIGIAPIMQVRKCVIKIVTFKGGHFMW